MAGKDDLRVLIVNPNYFRSSGVTKSIEQLVDGGHRLGVHFDLISCRYGIEAEYQGEWERQQRVSYFALTSPWHPRFWWDLCRFVLLLKSSRPDVLHVHHRRLLLYLAPICAALRLPMIYTAHLPYRKRRILRLVSPDVAVSVSRSVDSNVAETIRCARREIIGNGIRFPQTPPIYDYSNVVGTVVCIGRLVQQKNHSTLIDAWAIVCRTIASAELLLVGEGPLKADLEAQVSRLGLKDRVKFIGYVENPNLIISRSQFCVLPSLIEGQGIVTLEAAALRRATLVTDVDGSRDMIPPNAKLRNKVAVSNVTRLAEALVEWISSPEGVYSEGEIFFHHHRLHHSVDAMAAAYLTVYRSVALARL